MISTILIISISGALLVYWFRYACLLILSAKTTTDYAAGIAMANELDCLEVSHRLRANQPIANLDELSQRLHRDYQVVTYLLANAARFDETGVSGTSVGMENSMLRMNYKLVRMAYKVMAPFAPRQARRAVDEMAQIVCHFANVMGELASTGA